jgi:phospholipid transport system substrate-binding protein
MARFVLVLCALALAPAASSARAAGVEPAVTQVQTLSSALLKAMRPGPSESVTARYRELAPVIERVFALAFMTRLSVGPDWTQFSPQQQRALIAAFSRYTVANYAHNFAKFSGQSFDVDGNVITRGEDKVIQTTLTSPGATPSSLLYRMREVDGGWRVIDVYYNGVSQLTLHRVQFASAIAAGGAPVLIAYLNRVSDGLMK